MRDKYYEEKKSVKRIDEVSQASNLLEVVIKQFKENLFRTNTKLTLVSLTYLI